MKKYLSLFGILLMALFSMTSCLEHGLDDLDAYGTADIENWPTVYYRYYGTDKMAVNGEPQVKQIQLTRTDGTYDFDEEGVTGNPFFNITVTPSSNFPAEELANLNANNLVVVLSISTAAVVEPIEGAPKLGVPGDWSHPNKYKITAADGTTRVWTVTVNLVK